MAKKLTLFLIIITSFVSSLVHAQETKVLYLAGGCFWCVEADFEKLPGVEQVVSGYTGGDIENPTYKQVVLGGTGHYEAVEIKFDPGKISTDQLLDKFLRSIDVTDSQGQFCDRGESYRSAIFFIDSFQEQKALKAIKSAEEYLGFKVVTPIIRFKKFYPAEKYHQDYYKGKKIVMTRFGPKKQWRAYEIYREACERDKKVQSIWGPEAAFVN